MVVADNAGLTANVYLNNSDGTFKETASYRTDPTQSAYGPNSVTLAEIVPLKTAGRLTSWNQSQSTYREQSL